MAPSEGHTAASAFPDELAAIAPVEGALVSDGPPPAVPPPPPAAPTGAGVALPAPPPAPAPAPGTEQETSPNFGILDAGQQLRFLEALPVAAMLVDPGASVRYLNDRAAALIGRPRAELLGRSVLDFVSLDHLDFVVDMMNGGARFEGLVMGPSRVKYIDADGNEFWTQVWATNAPDDVCPGGFIVSLTGESVRDVLSVTATSVGVEGTLEWTLAGVADSARGLPLRSLGAVLTVEATAPSTDRRFRLVGEWPVDHAFIDDPTMPWRRALDAVEACDVDDVATSDLSGAARAAFAAAGVSAIFVRPIEGAEGETEGVFVIFRPDPGPSSSNMDDHIEDAVRLAGFAFTMARRQVELKQASYRDALTGLANRAAFNDRLRSERRATDVLFVDLDHFKEVNDTYGHDVGDRLLAMAAERIETTLRRGARAFRTGGDEFIVLCESTGDDPAERIALAERIVDVLLTPFDVDIHRIRIGATVGIAASGTRSLVDTVRAADTALYQAKNRGRSGWAHEGR